MITEIAFILDRSGSMGSVKETTINGFNSFLKDQQQAAGQTQLTLVLFDHEISTLYHSKPISECQPLDRSTYIPRGSTSLLDAVGITIDQLGERFAMSPPENQPNHVSFAILTDGEENSSTQYQWQHISQRITHQTEKYQWEFLFLGAGMDTIATASKLNIPTHNYAQFAADDVGWTSAIASLQLKINHSRSSRSSGNPAPAPDSVSMSRILKEEDHKRRTP